MYLSSDILFESLPDELDASIFGPRNQDLTLQRPQLFEGGNEPFLANHLHLCYADRIPHHAHVDQGSVIFAIGESDALQWCKKRGCVITVPESADFFHTFNAIQEIFNRFDDWERTLTEGALTGDIQSMLNSSLAIFNNPIYCLDSDFRVLSVAFPAGFSSDSPEDFPVNGDMLELESMNKYLNNREPSISTREPIVISLLDQVTLNYNLYDEDDFQGCITIHYIDAPYRPSDKHVIKFLGKSILQAMKHVSLASADSQSIAFAKVIRDLVEEKPLDAVGRAMLLKMDSLGTMICARLKPFDESRRLPLGYIRSMVEDALDHCITFEYHRNSVVAFMSVTESDQLPAIIDNLEMVAQSLGLKVGLSDCFENLVESRLRFTQANRALDLGIAHNNERNVYPFSDYALIEMIDAATAQMPLEFLAPAGLLKLAEHDQGSSASYIATLRCYLNNNMSITQTAKDLYIHRSTLAERLARIERELDVNLHDPDVQLQLRILLKAMQIRDDEVSA